jgi:hypothetical protein
VRRLPLRALLAAVVAAALTMVVIVAAGWSPRVEYVLAVASVAVVVAIALRRMLDAVAGPVWPSPVPTRRAPAAVDPRVNVIETALRRGTDDAGVCRRRLQPMLLDLAIHRLSRHRGVGLVEDPAEARRMLGDEPFHVLSDVVEVPVTPGALARTVDAIERL